MNRGSPEGPLFGARWAAGLGAALLLVFAGVTAFAIHDRMNLASLDTVSQPTAVGDGAFVAPAARTLGMTVATWQGVPLHLAELKNVDVPDPAMLKAGMDDTKVYTIYKAASAPDAASFYLKNKNDGYLKVTR